MAEENKHRESVAAPQRNRQGSQPVIACIQIKGFGNLKPIPNPNLMLSTLNPNPDRQPHMNPKALILNLK